MLRSAAKNFKDAAVIVNPSKYEIVLKELRETFVCLRIIYTADLTKTNDKIKRVLQECNELIAIFAKSIETAEKKNTEADLR